MYDTSPKASLSDRIAVSTIFSYLAAFHKAKGISENFTLPSTDVEPEPIGTFRPVNTIGDLGIPGATLAHKELSINRHGVYVERSLPHT